MKSILKPALENLDKALLRLETAIDKRFDQVKKETAAPQLALSTRDNRAAGKEAGKDVSRKIASKLDQTINRLQTLLAEG